MRAKGVTRREAITGAALLIGATGSSVVADDKAKPSSLPPGYGDGQLIAVSATLRGYGGTSEIGASFHVLLGFKASEYEEPKAPY